MLLYLIIGGYCARISSTDFLILTCLCSESLVRDPLPSSCQTNSLVLASIRFIYNVPLVEVYPLDKSQKLSK